MTIHAEPRNPLPVVVDVTGPLIHVAPTPHWTVLDDDRVLFGVVVLDQRVDAQTYAARVAELLERHGLIDAPDSTEDLT